MKKPAEAKYLVINEVLDVEPWDILQAQTGRGGVRGPHEDLKDANISMLWAFWKPTKDGRQTLGKMALVPEAYSRVTALDFLLMLHKPSWEAFAEADDPARVRRYLVDHELSHGAPQTDEETGDQKVDATGRLLWRIVKHDLEEFYGPIERHGLCLADVRRFADVAQRAQVRFPFAESEVERLERDLSPRKLAGIAALGPLQ